MTAEDVVAAKRQAWLDAQPLPNAIRSRLSLQGDMLVAKPWLADLAGSVVDPALAIRLPLSS